MQGYAGYNIMDTAVTIKDSANLDAFSRLRISNPLTLFSSQFTYNLNPLLFEQITSGAGAAIAHDATNRLASMTFTATPLGGQAYMQSYEYIPYQPSKSQLVFVTFNMNGSAANTLKFAGLSDGTNGYEFQNNGTDNRFVVYSASLAGTTVVLQSSWNIDPLDGSGPSGITLDITRTQILVIDFQALYVGRVRMGFDIDGTIVYAHEFLNANNAIYPYIQTANLPVRCGMTCSGVSTTTMNFICCAVVSEGGIEDSNAFGYAFAQTSGVVSVATGRTHVLSLRPKTTFNTITNRIKTVVFDLEMYNAGNQPVYWELCIGQAISGTTAFNDVNTTYSSVEYNVLGTISGSPAIVVESGWIESSGGVKGVSNEEIGSKYPITLDAAGLQRTLGTISLVMTSLSGSQNCYGSLRFREIR